MDYQKYREYMQSAEWSAVRRIALHHSGRKCALCGSQRNLEVHHRNYEALFEETLEDLTVLCRGCHSSHHGKIASLPPQSVQRWVESVAIHYPAYRSAAESAEIVRIDSDAMFVVREQLSDVADEDLASFYSSILGEHGPSQFFIGGPESRRDFMSAR